MDGSSTGVIVTVAVVAVLYVVAMAALIRYAGARTPADIVRRLSHSGQSVVVRVNALNHSAWDPSRRISQGGFFQPGTATYTLPNPTTVHVRFEPRSGAVVEREGQIPAFMVPDSPETRHRRRVARAVIALYIALGVAAFVVTASLVTGSASLRLRAAALVAFGVVVVTWLLTHLVLTRTRQPADGDADPHRPRFVQLRHLLAWFAGLVVVSLTLAVAWRIDSLDQPHPTPWVSAFIDAFVFVFVCAAALAAIFHHYNYVHHDDHHAWPSAAP